MSDSVSVRRGRPVKARTLFLRFLAWSLLIATVCGLTVSYGVPWLIDVDPRHVASMREMGMWVALSFALVTIGTAATTLYRTRPILRYLLRASDAEDVPPPSAQAIEEASFVHTRATRAGLAAGALVPILELVGVLETIPLSPQQRIARDLLFTAIGALGAQRIALVWAGGLWQWLGRLHPSLITQEFPRAMAFRSARRVLLSMLGILAPLTMILYALAAPGDVRTFALSMAVTLFVSFGAAGAALLRAHAISNEVVELAAAARRYSSGGSLHPLTFETTSHDTAAIKKSLELFSDRIDLIAIQRAQAYRAMEDAQRLKTQFFASMSHDLRSPLNSIVGFSDLLASEVEGPLSEGQRENVRAIQKSASELLALLTDVLDSARLEAGRLPIHRSWVLVSEIFIEVEKRVRPLIEERSLKLVVDVPASLPRIYVDADRITQALTSLVKRAARVTSVGSICVRAFEEDGPPGPEHHVAIDVSDRGQVIPETERELIFEAFRGITQPSGTRVAGLGLSLSLSRGLARAVNGDVWCKASTNEGSTFTMALPTERAPLTSEGQGT